MIRKKIVIAVIAAAAVMLIGSNEYARACKDTAEEFIAVRTNAAVDAEIVQADVSAAMAAVEKAKAQVAKAAQEHNNFGTGSFIYPEYPANPYIPDIPTNLINKVVNQTNGDIIETNFDTVTNATTTSMICPRKDSPDTITVTSQSGTDTTITGDGDTFTCNMGYYGNSISPVSISPDYNTSIKIQLQNSSQMTGEINSNNVVEYVSLTLDSTSKWIVEGTSYLTVLINADTTLSNIIDNGNTIYYNSSNNANSWLEGKTYTLGGGGKLMPIK